MLRLGDWIASHVRVCLSQQMKGWLILHELSCERRLVVGVMMRLSFY